jgi:hypothetical protein
MGFLRLILSDHQPEATFNRLAVLSAIPSMSPITAVLAPKTSTVKRGKSGKIISVLMSVSMLATPSTTTLSPKPKSVFLFGN